MGKPMHIWRFKAMIELEFIYVRFHNLPVFILHGSNNIIPIRNQMAGSRFFIILFCLFTDFITDNDIFFFQKIPCIAVNIKCGLFHCNTYDILVGKHFVPLFVYFVCAIENKMPIPISIACSKFFSLLQ